MFWAREMGVTSTQDVTGRQLPLVTASALELGNDWLHTTGPRLPRLTVAAQKSWKKIWECSQVYWLWEELEMGPQRKIGWDLNSGTVAMTRRTTWLWVSLCHTAYEAGKQDVAAIADLSLSSFERMQERCWGKEKGERTLAGRQWEGAMWFWIKNWRFRWYSWWCWEPREAYQLSRDYWGNLSHGSLFLFLRCGTLHQAKGVRKDCVCLWVF